MACPGSVALVDKIKAQFGDEPSGPYAIEGTHAHSMADMCLRSSNFDSSCYAGMHLSDKEGVFEVTKEMQAAVDVYLAECGKVAAIPGIEWMSERRVTLAHIDARMFGTCDFSAYDAATRTLYVMDYKHGAGIPVDVENNPQALFYAIGAWVAQGMPDFDAVNIAIVQPRAHGEPVKRWRASYFDIVDFEAALLAAVKAADAPNAPLVPGEHCRKHFCRARSVCPAVREAAMKAVHDDFGQVADPTKFSRDELGRRLFEANQLRSYLKILEEHAASEAASGRIPTGWTLRASEGRRAWNPGLAETEIATALSRISNGVDPWQKSLISPAQAEKALGKKTFEQLHGLVHKPAGAPKLVPAGKGVVDWDGDKSGFDAV